MIDIHLTEKGQENALEVLNIVFKYIKLLKLPGGICREVFDELKSLDEMQFNFKDKSDPYACVQSTANAIHIYDEQDILRGRIPQVNLLSVLFTMVDLLYGLQGYFCVPIAPNLL